MQDQSGNIHIGDVLAAILSFLLAIPLYILAHRLLPDMEWPFHLDRVLLMVIIGVLLMMILRVFRMVIIVAFIAATGWLAYGSYTGKYGFENIYSDYRAMLYAMRHDPNPERFIFLPRKTSPRNQQLLSLVNNGSPEVRSFAINATNAYFKKEQDKFPEYRNLIQAFAIFRKINSNWNYVNDPPSREYFAPAAESAKLLAGDCDDHSVLMAAAIDAIGGRTRLIITTGHIYPELYIGSKNDLEQANFLIKKQLFPTASEGKDLHYHIDEQGKIWINLDYTATYPGGQFMDEPVLEILYPR